MEQCLSSREIVASNIICHRLATNSMIDFARELIPGLFVGSYHHAANGMHCVCVTPQRADELHVIPAWLFECGGFAM